MKNKAYMIFIKKRFNITILIILFIMIFMSFFDINNSGDEDINVTYGEYIFNYIKTIGKDKSYLKEGPRGGPLYAYNYTFDVISLFTSKLFNLDLFNTRHFLNTIIGWLIILFSSLISKRYFGVNTAIITAIFLFISPVFLGHSFNNPKDIPFTFGYIISIYYMLIFLDQIPKVKVKSAIILGIAIGIALNTRIGALLLAPYLGLFIIIKLIIINYNEKYIIQKIFNDLKLLIKPLLIVGLISYTLMIIFWPFVLENPISGIFKSLKLMTNFSDNIRQLFEGFNVLSGTLPWYYLFKYIFISNPLIIIIGFLGSFFIILMKRKEHKKYLFLFFILFFTFIFPITYAIYKKSNLYGTWRHFLFIYPSIVILASYSIHYLLSKIKYSRYFIKIPIYIVFCGLIILPLIHIIKYHPYQYIYYNELIGKMKNAYGNYELDYYGHSLKKAFIWLVKNEKITPNDSIVLATNYPTQLSLGLREKYPNIQFKYVRYYERESSNWDYAIFPNSYVNSHDLKSKNFPPYGTIHTLDIEEYPICAILKRKSNLALEGNILFNENNFRGAIDKFLLFLNEDSKNIDIYYKLSLAYNNINKSDSLIYYLEKGDIVNPQYQGIFSVQNHVYLNLNQIDLFLKNNINYLNKYDYSDIEILKDICEQYLNQKNIRKTLFFADKIIKYYPNNPLGYQIKYYAYLNSGKKKKAIEYQNIIKKL